MSRHIIGIKADICLFLAQKLCQQQFECYGSILHPPKDPRRSSQWPCSWTLRCFDGLGGLHLRSSTHIPPHALLQLRSGIRRRSISWLRAKANPMTSRDLPEWRSRKTCSPTRLQSCWYELEILTSGCAYRIVSASGFVSENTQPGRGAVHAASFAWREP